MFQQIWPAMPRIQINVQFFDEMPPFLINLNPFHHVVTQLVQQIVMKLIQQPFVQLDDFPVIGQNSV